MLGGLPPLTITAVMVAALAGITALNIASVRVCPACGRAGRLHPFRRPWRCPTCKAPPRLRLTGTRPTDEVFSLLQY